MSNLKFDAETRYLYCEHLRKHGNRTLAARACGVTPATVARARKEDPSFEVEVDEALEAFYDYLNQDALRGILDGAQPGKVCQFLELLGYQHFRAAVSDDGERILLELFKKPAA